MSKDKFIKQGGQTKAPYPIYPNEIRDSDSSLGKMKNTDLSLANISLADKEKANFTFGLIAKQLSTKR